MTSVNLIKSKCPDTNSVSKLYSKAQTGQHQQGTRQADERRGTLESGLWMLGESKPALSNDADQFVATQSGWVKCPRTGSYLRPGNRSVTCKKITGRIQASATGLPQGLCHRPDNLGFRKVSLSRSSQLVQSMSPTDSLSIPVIRCGD